MMPTTFGARSSAFAVREAGEPDFVVCTEHGVGPAGRTCHPSRPAAVGQLP